MTFIVPSFSVHNTSFRVPSYRGLSLGSLSEASSGWYRAFHFLCHLNLNHSKHNRYAFPSQTQRTLFFLDPSSSLTVSKQHHVSTNGCHHPLLICYFVDSAPQLDCVPIFTLSLTAAVYSTTLFCPLPHPLNHQDILTRASSIVSGHRFSYCICYFPC